MGCRDSSHREAELRFNPGLSYSKVHMTAAFKYFQSNYDVYKQKGVKELLLKSKSFFVERRKLFQDGCSKWTNDIC